MYGVIVNGLRRLAKELEDAQLKEEMASELEAMTGKNKKVKKETQKEDQMEEDESDGELDD